MREFEGERKKVEEYVWVSTRGHVITTSLVGVLTVYQTSSAVPTPFLIISKGLLFTSLHDYMGGADNTRISQSAPAMDSMVELLDSVPTETSINKHGVSICKLVNCKPLTSQAGKQGVLLFFLLHQSSSSIPTPPGS